MTVPQMAIALGATGYFMAIDVPITPRAVVGCVIIYNAFFGYRYSWRFMQRTSLLKDG